MRLKYWTKNISYRRVGGNMSFFVYCRKSKMVAILCLSYQSYIQPCPGKGSKHLICLTISSSQLEVDVTKG